MSCPKTGSLFLNQSTTTIIYRTLHSKPQFYSYSSDIILLIILLLIIMCKM